MIKALLLIVIEKLDERSRKDSNINNKIVDLIEELDELEERHAQAIANVERWGDIKDKSNWRTVEANRIHRLIKAKERMIEALKD